MNRNILPKHTVRVDEPLFLKLLSRTRSLTLNEKRDIIFMFDTLSQSQVDDLVAIFKREEEELQQVVAAKPWMKAGINREIQQRELEWTAMLNEVNVKSPSLPHWVYH